MQDTSSLFVPQPQEFLDFPIKRLLDEYPQTAAVFMTHHMACIGCSVSGFENLAEALQIYDLPEEPFLAEIMEIVIGCQPGRSIADRSYFQSIE